MSQNMLQEPTTGLGVVSLLLILVGLALTGIVAFKQDLLAKLGNAQTPVINFGPIGVAGLTLLFVFIAGFSNLQQYVHLGVGFYFLVLALGAVIASSVIRRFVLKDMYTANGFVAPQQPVQPQPVMNQGPVQPQQPVNNQQPPINPNQQ